MTRNQKIFGALALVGVAFVLYKVLQSQATSEPTISKKGKANFSDEEGTVYNEYGTPFVRPRV